MLMKNKRNIYCDYHFWEEFFEMEECIIHDRSKRKLWDAFYDFLSNNNLYFNITKQEINEESNGGSNLAELSRKKGGAGIKFVDSAFPRIESLSDVDDNLLNSVFLTMLDTPDCESLSHKFGVVVFNLSMIFSAEHVYIDNGIALYQANGQNWGFLMTLNDRNPCINCCNSLVISDRYLLYDKNESSISNNLRPIFEAFLPQTLDNDICFTICIIAEYNIEKCSSIDNKLQVLITLIKELRPNLFFKLNVFHSWLHDRSILTNNVILTSGAGFDVVGINDVPLRFTTTSLCFPFLQNNSDNSLYLDWINNVLIKERKCRTYNENYWGDKSTKHHLLDFYYDKPQPPINKRFGNIPTVISKGIVEKSYQPKNVFGIFHKGESGMKDIVVQQQYGYKHQIRSVREGVLLNDGDEVEYSLCCEPNKFDSTKKFWYAKDVHLKE